MPYNSAGLNLAVDGLAGGIAYASLHSADPSTTGANEISGGSPAYARLAPTWNAASAGQRDLSADLTFDIPAGTTVAYVGYWSALTGGTFYGGFALTSETFTAQGQYVLEAASTALDVNAV